MGHALGSLLRHGLGWVAQAGSHHDLSVEFSHTSRGITLC